VVLPVSRNVRRSALVSMTAVRTVAYVPPPPAFEVEPWAFHAHHPAPARITTINMASPVKWRGRRGASCGATGPGTPLGLKSGD
jgi:hypothetical protein